MSCSGDSCGTSSLSQQKTTPPPFHQVFTKIIVCKRLLMFLYLTNALFKNLKYWHGCWVRAPRDTCFRGTLAFPDFVFCLVSTLQPIYHCSLRIPEPIQNPVSSRHHSLASWVNTSACGHLWGHQQFGERVRRFLLVCGALPLFPQQRNSLRLKIKYLTAVMCIE